MWWSILRRLEKRVNTRIFTLSSDKATSEAIIIEISVMSCYILPFQNITQFNLKRLSDIPSIKIISCRIIGESYGSLWVDTNFGVELFPAKTDNWNEIRDCAGELIYNAKQFVSPPGSRSCDVYRMVVRLKLFRICFFGFWSECLILCIQ
jgi:hypothetical protein